MALYPLSPDRRRAMLSMTVKSIIFPHPHAPTVGIFPQTERRFCTRFGGEMCGCGFMPRLILPTAQVLDVMVSTQWMGTGWEQLETTNVIYKLMNNVGDFSNDSMRAGNKPHLTWQRKVPNGKIGSFASASSCWEWALGGNGCVVRTPLFN